MRKAVLSLLLFSAFSGLKAQWFDPFINYLETLPEQVRQSKVDSFLNTGPLFPVTGTDSACHFIYSGTAHSVSVAGDFTAWKADSFELSPLPGTNLWHLEKKFEPDARLDYKLVINGEEWILDPGNPFTCEGGYGANSELRMPGYRRPEETLFHPDIPHGKILDTLFYSTARENERHIRIYLPPGYGESMENYPVILFHDGIDFLDLGNAAGILDNLAYHYRTEPVIGVFVPPVERDSEFAGDSIKELYSKFIVHELMPFIDRTFRTIKDPGMRGTIGISQGGNIALYLTLKYPEVFGLAGAMSSNIIPEVRDGYRKGKNSDIRIYLDIGTYDIAVLIPRVNDFSGILEKGHYKYRLNTWHDGHSWCNWRNHLPAVLKYFLAYK